MNDQDVFRTLGTAASASASANTGPLALQDEIATGRGNATLGAYRFVGAVLASTVLTLLALAPAAYGLHRSLARPVAIIDLQALVEENEAKIAASVSSRPAVTSTASRRPEREISAGIFAVKLSQAVEAIARECDCILINKAAVLGGEAEDLTDVVKARLAK